LPTDDDPFRCSARPHLLPSRRGGRVDLSAARSTHTAKTRLDLFQRQPTVHDEAEAAPAAFVDGDAGVSLEEAALQQDQACLEVLCIFRQAERRVEAELTVGELGAAVSGVLACDLPQDRTASRSRPLSFTSRPT
jgi:hypothetical protein